MKKNVRVAAIAAVITKLVKYALGHAEIDIHLGPEAVRLSISFRRQPPIPLGGDCCEK